jgi:precorrin-6A/cobalt-precorrin-6A reductase
MTRVLIIGGSAEAWQLARLVPQAQVRLTAPERVPRNWPGVVTRGAVTAQWLRDQAVERVVIAPHPCDAVAVVQATKAAQAAEVPFLHLIRPAWRATRRDRWHVLRSAPQAAQVIPRGARVLVTLGRDTLPQLNGLRAQCLVRQLGAPGGNFPLRQGRFLPAKGPFSIAHEIGFLRRERIDWLLLRNAGGQGGWPKLAAARHLGISVALINRPSLPMGPRVTKVEEAETWLKR